MNTKERIKHLEERLANREAKLKQTGFDLVNAFSPTSFITGFSSMDNLKQTNVGKILKDDNVKTLLKLALGFVITRVVLGKNKPLSKPIYSIGSFLVANFPPAQANRLIDYVSELITNVFSKKKKKKKEKVVERSSDQSVLESDYLINNLKSDTDKTPM